MAEEESKKVEPETCSPAVEAPPPAPVEAVADEKPIVPDDDDCKALAIIPKAEAIEEKKPEECIDRDEMLARVATEKRLSLIKAWEESEKSKTENKAQKKISAIAAWENSKKASLEAELKKIEEKLEKKKAEYIEKTKNKVALLHKAAEEKRAIVEAKCGEDLLKAEEVAAKYRAMGTSPKKLLSFF